MALRSPCLSVLASKPGPGLPANWRDCISPGGEAGRRSLAPRHSVKTPVASEHAHAWVLLALRDGWSFVRPPLLWASQQRPEGGQPLIGVRRDVGLGAGDGSVTTWSSPGPARRPGAPARGLPADWAGGLCRGRLGGRSPSPASPPPDTRLIHPPTGGFATFSSCFPGLCEGKPAALLPMSLSQPCLPVPSVGLTRILPHLYLGSQKDVLNKVRVQPELEPLLGWSGGRGAGTGAGGGGG